MKIAGWKELSIISLIGAAVVVPAAFARAAGTSPGPVVKTKAEARSAGAVKELHADVTLKRSANPKPQFVSVDVVFDREGQNDNPQLWGEVDSSLPGFPAGFAYWDDGEPGPQNIP